MPTFCQNRAREDHHWTLSKLRYFIIPVFYTFTFTLTACGTNPGVQNITYLEPAAIPSSAIAAAQATATTLPPPAGSVSEAFETGSNTKAQPVISAELDSENEPMQCPFTFKTGLISLTDCTSGLNGILLTSRAGEILLYDRSLSSTPPPTQVASQNQHSPRGTTNDVATLAGTRIKSVSNLSATVTKPEKQNGTTQALLTGAYSQSGRPFKAGGKTPEAGFDAAGFTSWVYGQKGIRFPKNLEAQANNGRQVIREELRPGDLLVYRGASKGKNEYHVGIYTGQGNFLHTNSKTGVVTETAAFGRQFEPYFISGRRYFDDPQAAPLTDSQKMMATSSAIKLALAELGPNDKLKRPKIKARRR